MIKEILISEKEFAETNYKRLEKGFLYIENNLIDSDEDMYLIVDFLIEINKTINSYNITLNSCKIILL